MIVENSTFWTDKWDLNWTNDLKLDLYAKIILSVIACWATSRFGAAMRLVAGVLD
jgi:hypothetical protein